MQNSIQKLFSREGKTLIMGTTIATIASLFLLVSYTVAIEPDPVTTDEAAAIVADVKGEENKAIISVILEEEAQSYVEEQLRQVEDDPIAYLNYKGQQEGLAQSEINAMQGIMYCESKYNPYAINAYSGASGLFQFLPSSWAAWGNGGDPFSIPDNVSAAITYYKAAGTAPWVCPPVYVTPYSPMQ